jgi:all-trans-retinol dehydrogenase (NAD+)
VIAVHHLAHFEQCDITSPAAVDAAAASVRATIGHPSILINNAGMIVFKPLLEESPAQLDKMVAVNLTSHWNTIRAFLPNMIVNNKGHVLATASMASYVTVASTTGYAATKAAVLTLYEGKGHKAEDCVR